MMSNYAAFSEKLATYNGESTCPVIQTLDILHGKWTLKILFFLLLKETMRFGEFRKSIPKITNTMLASTLKELEEQGIINRTQFNEIPPHVEYSLSKKGKDLVYIFYELGFWGAKYL